MGVNENEEPKGKYERRDLNLKGVSIFVISLLAMLVIVHFVVIGTFRYFLATEPKPESQSFVNAPPVGPASPGLLINAPQRLSDFRAQEDQILNNYGWMDRRQGIVRLPIDQAMNLMVQRGLPPKITGRSQQPSGGKTP